MAPKKEGWAKIKGGKFYHYILNGESLCSAISHYDGGLFSSILRQCEKMKCPKCDFAERLREAVMLTSATADQTLKDAQLKQPAERIRMKWCNLAGRPVKADECNDCEVCYGGPLEPWKT